MSRAMSLVLLELATATGCQDEEWSEAPPAADIQPFRFSVQIDTLPDQPRARETTRVNVRVNTRTELAPELHPIANRPVHLVVVNRDLTWYQHLHPRAEGDLYAATVNFPGPGEYVLHAILRPKDRGQLVEKRIVRVGGDAMGSARRPPSVSPREIRSGRYTVRLRTSPDPPAVGIWNSLIFDISRNGKPVTNLTPTGTLGHLVILGEGGEDFVYAHSTDGEAKSGVRARAHQPAAPPSLDTSHGLHVGDTGPEVTFHTQFPRSGRYRMWVELDAGDDAIKTDFVVHVSEQVPSLPHAH